MTSWKILHLPTLTTYYPPGCWEKRSVECFVERNYFYYHQKGNYLTSTPREVQFLKDDFVRIQRCELEVVEAR